MTTRRMPGRAHLVWTFSLWLAMTLAGWSADFSGTWSTTWGNTTKATKLVMKQDGKNVSGRYNFRGGMIAGKADGRTLTGTWIQKDNGASGTFAFVLSPDGQSFKGRWRMGSTGPWARDEWNGVRTGK